MSTAYDFLWGDYLAILMQMSLYSKTAKGIKWSFVGTIINIVIQIISGIVLARLLSPYEFGIYGMSFAVIAISRSIIDSGLYQALIQRNDVDQTDYSIVFQFNFVISIIIVLILFFFAHDIEGFYNQVGVNISLVVKFLSLIILIEPFSIIQKVSLMKEIKFDTITKVESYSKIVSVSASVILAWNGFGIWSLLAKDLLFSLVSTVTYWYVRPVRLHLKVPLNRLSGLLDFGFKIFIADQIENISNHISQFIVGWKFNPNSLGLFNKAEEFQQLFSQVGVVSINKVMFPSLVKIQDDDVKLKLTYKVLMETTMIVVLPLLFGVILVADELITIMIGSNWIEIIPYFKILCVSGMFYPLTVYNLNIIKVKGNGGLYLKTCLISKGLLLPFILTGVQYGLIGLVISLVAHRFIAAMLNSYHSGRLINYGLLEQLSGISISFIISFVIYFFLLIWKQYFLSEYSIYQTFFILTSGYSIAYLVFTILIQSDKIGPMFYFFNPQAKRRN
ncbi:MAG: lipopolysaccharide biosynthesis protein [Bacteroidetes bacterium]|jgi:O-antigen/teichoic acid export membrane protein|nr:lipopolysaccharide biosynthesis protein [Bacteroidota bacterium]